MANALKVQGDPATESTRLVIEYFNQFFDCLNVSSRYEGDRKRNPALQPYKDVNDWRFIVSCYKQAVSFISHEINSIFSISPI